MGMSGDEIVVGITGNSEGLQAASAAGVASLTELQAALLELADSSKVIGAQMLTTGANFASVGASAEAYAAQIAALRGEQEMATEQVERGMTPAFEGMGASVMGAASNFKTLLETMAGLWVIQQATDWFNRLAQSVRDAGQEILNLNINTERNEFMWQYQYAQGGKPDPQLAQQIAAWTYKFSYQVPFTRQDLMTGIGAMAPMGLNLQGLQQYAPLVADLASTHASIFGTGGQLTFSQVAFALMEAMTTGNARRMMMELQIQPRMLEQYGVKFAGSGHVGGQILNPWQFLPALQELSNAKGWSGASQAAAHQTFWGEQSSFIDRIQNLMLNIGGMNPDTTVRQGSMFGSIKKDMEDISAWIDAHQQQLMKLADLIGDKGIGGALKVAREMATGFLQGLNASGVGNDLLQQFMKFGEWLADPNNQQQLRGFGEALGRDTGANLKEIGDGIHSIASGLKSFKDALGPDGTKAMINGIGKLGDAFKVLGFILGGDLDILSDIVRVAGDLKNGNIAAAVKDAAQFSADLVYYQSLGIVKLPGTTPTGTGQNGAQGGNPAAGSASGPTYLRNKKTGQVIVAPNAPYDKNTYEPYSPSASSQQSNTYSPAPAGSEWVKDPQGHIMLMPLRAAAMMSETYTPLAGVGNAETRRGPLSPGAYNQQIAQLQQAEQQMGSVTKQNVATTGNTLQQQAKQAATGAANAFHTTTAGAGWEQWGADAIKLFIAGMKSQTPQLNVAATAAADVIHQVLGFSKPSRGPLANADRYMPDFIALLVSGLNAGLPELRAAAMRAGSAISGGLSITGGPTINGGATNVHFHGLPEPVMTRQIKQQKLLADQHAATLSRAPGGLRVFGSYGS